MTETLTTENGRTVLRMERRLTHPQEKVWRALTSPAELAGWFPAAVEVDLRLDGAISFTFPDGVGDFQEDPDNNGVVSAFEPPRLLEYTWGGELLRWELSPTDDGCLLTLTATYDDRPGSASYTAGWIICLDALEKVLGGSAVPAKDYAELHEHFIKVYGLDQGVVADDGSLHFERQLVRPKEDVWPVLAAGFVAKGIEPGETVEHEMTLSYPWQHGLVTVALRDGNGGARLTLTQTGPAAEYLEAWRELIERLAADEL
ncbi:SRPBCC family protein [Kribbella qitaiheensis]|uniref:SRPBCC family protein n=1 Tax=Kribbella qitaiheensis TaxID=1544730 RepID=A0A7G6WTE2_9ACTN|nr:SRPBCC family protein [Kribbella qitaiheensis]QNE17257.1 SRPBCC family protein [Kribbella qitaiheensis]